MMDPVSVSGLIIAVEQILCQIYKFGQGVQGAKKEISQLCSELFALKGALEHARMSLDGTTDLDKPRGNPQPLLSPLLNTDEFSSMLSSADSLLRDLSKRLSKSPGRLNSIMQSLAWPLKKDDIMSIIQRLERLKSYLILATTTDNMELCKQIYRQICSIAQRLDQQQEQQEKLVHDEFRKSVIQWLAPYDPSLSHESALAAHQPGTGQWFLEGPFFEWTSGQSPAVLWLRAGVGKTTLLSAAVNKTELQNHNESTNLAYYYCSFTDLSSQDPVNILGSFLMQLCNQNPNFWTDIDDLYRTELEKGSKSIKRLGLDELESALKTLCTALPKVYLFLDAPNESKQSSMISSSVLSLAQGSEALRIMISSTDESPSLQRGPPVLFPVTISSERNTDDIETYVEYCLDKQDRLRKLPDPLKSDIKSKLIREADGMFRWVYCQIESLILQNTPMAIRAALDEIPSTLEQTYSKILARIPREDRHLAKQTLFWLTFSLRALSYTELCEAVIVDDDDISINENSRLLPDVDLLRICSSLVSYDSSKQHITLAHSSVLAYLTSKQMRDREVHDYYFLDGSSADAILTRKCLKYLGSSAFSSGYCDTAEELYSRSKSWPLLGYCTNKWPIHARYVEDYGVDIDDQTRVLLLRFFDTSRTSRGGNFGAWVQAFFHPFARLNIESSTPLYYASRFGLNSMVKLILTVEGTASLEIRGGRRGSTPLHVAAALGEVEVVKTLLAAGANAQEVNEMGECGLEWAIRIGSLEVVRLLLAAGTDPNFRNRQGLTPLYYSMAKWGRHFSAVLIEAGADATNLNRL